MQYIILPSFQDVPDRVVLITPHSASRRAASLYVGLKSLALSGHLRRIGIIVQTELW
ncbi:hypothetical protein Barb4_02524 [Bacteroidales bacterium Barb4]|nr:hypothetical protein Barb4_02524 [Bacteroidales bacterium Barb4]